MLLSADVYLFEIKLQDPNHVIVKEGPQSSEIQTLYL